jgi:carbonic anhydrase
MVFTMETNGVQAAYPSDGSCTLDTMEIPGQEGVYAAIQFHLHTSTEHTIDGSFFTAELHVVHVRVWDGELRLAVVGIIFDTNNSMNNPLFETLLTKLDESNDATIKACVGEDVIPEETPGVVFNIYTMLDSDTGFYQYDGGLTTPPCTEIVWWNLADTMVNISVEQYNRLFELVQEAIDDQSCASKTVADPTTGSTSRPPVPLGDRTVQRVCPKDALAPDEDDDTCDKFLIFFCK